MGNEKKNSADNAAVVPTGAASNGGGQGNAVAAPQGANGNGVAGGTGSAAPASGASGAPDDTGAPANPGADQATPVGNGSSATLSETPAADAPAPDASTVTVSAAGASLHPSGNDRTVENGGSGTQGNAQSDPDGLTNQGVDQAGGTGGVDAGDRDGNNGCGNDQDFEDDNNGNCGGVDRTPDAPALPAVGDAPVVPTVVDVMPTVGGSASVVTPVAADGAQPTVTVTGSQVVDAQGQPADPVQAQRDGAGPMPQATDAVAGASDLPIATAGAAEGFGTIQPVGFATGDGGELPFTGAPSLLLVLAALLSISIGLGTRMHARTVAVRS